MISTERVSKIPKQLWRNLAGDVANFFSFVAPYQPPEPGMYTYDIEPPGGKIRIHLRLEGDGSGVLFPCAGTGRWVTSPISPAQACRGASTTVTRSSRPSSASYG